MSFESVEYERVVQEMFQALVNQDTIKNVDVQHHVTLKGRSGAPHEIDVYWEFEVADTRYRTCIECKQWKNKVKKIQVAALAGVLDDIDGATGILATTVGFQSGAKLLAKEKNIRLVLVQPLISKIVGEVTLIVPKVEDWRLEFNEADTKAKLRAAKRENLAFSFCGMATDTYFCNSTGNPTVSFQDVIDGADSGLGEHAVPLADTYFSTEIGPIRVDSLCFIRDEDRIEFTTVAGGDHVARTVIEDVLKNTTSYLHADGSVNPTLVV